jgi:glutamyl-tRNA reductase
MNLFCIGLSHHTASVATLERYAVRPEIEPAVLDQNRCAEAILLTTCNRVEVYAASETTMATRTIARYLAREPDPDESDVFYRYEGEHCVQHLFRVTSGLDSMVVGETEILGQAKKAYARARESGRAGPYLHRLFQRAFRVAKHVRSVTDITRGAVSVGSVAVDLAQKIFGKLTERKVLIVGAGETSERTARALISRGVSDLRLTNRSNERACNLAQDIGARAIPFQQWLEECREVDILISSTSSDQPLLTRKNLAPILRDRPDRPFFIIDIAVPRDVEPEVNQLPGVYLYDMDSLQSIAQQALALRREQVAAGEEIIANHVADFCDRVLRSGSSAQQTPSPDPISEPSVRVLES